MAPPLAGSWSLGEWGTASFPHHARIGPVDNGGAPFVAQFAARGRALPRPPGHVEELTNPMMMAPHQPTCEMTVAPMSMAQSRTGRSVGLM